MIDQVLSSSNSGVTLEAQNVFRAGCHAYLDYDFLVLRMSVLSAMPEGQGAAPLAVFGKVTSMAPTVFAVTFADARARLQAQVPLEPFLKMVKREK